MSNEVGVGDQAHAVREGEELDVPKLSEYLKAQLPQFDLTGELTVKQFPHGFSNLTYLIQAGEQEFVLRRPPFTVEIKSAHDMEREYRVLSGLCKVYSRVPQPLIYCADPTVLGAPFYVMKRVKGIVLRAEAPKQLDLNPAMMQRLSTAFIDNLADIHGLDYRAAGLENLGKPQGYIQRQISGWTQRYIKAKTDDIPDIEKVATWLAEHLPPEGAPGLIHNDYKYDNVILDPADLSNIKAVLDWEMATLGDPLMDLGSSLAYWIEPDDPEDLQTTRFGVTTLPGNLNRAEFVQRYSQRSGREVSDIVFFYAYGLFKLAVVSQQLYLRYKLGFTTEDRYARTLQSVKVLSRVSRQVIERNRV